MAKKIKFPIEMKDGVMVRTIEELRENFDVEKLVEHYESGKLESWLQDRYYDVELQKISELNREGKKFVPLLCDCFGITVQEEEVSEIDAEFLKRRVEKLNHLKSLTEDKMLLSRVDDIAITQEDLMDLLDSGKSEIYLCEGDFTVPVSVPNKTYTGIFNPTAVIRAVDNVNFKKQNITFNDMVFIWDVSGLTPKDRSYRAERLFMEKQYEKAADICRELVKEDNPRALMLLDRMNGSYIIWNAKEAMECQDRGVQINSIHSLLDNDERQFIERYRELLKRAAETGTSFDEFYYGLSLYTLGCDNGGNYSDEMITFYQKAAQQGNPSACSGLGSRYESGQGVPQDYQKAIEWYQKAADKGHRDAMQRIAWCYHSIGRHYRYGNGVVQDYVEAMKWYQRAAEMGISCSQKEIGDLYYYGYGVSQDYEKALEWYQKATDNGDLEAMESLAHCYTVGNGVTKDYNKSLEWRRKAAERGNVIAISNIGWHYRYGNGVAQDYVEAMKWYQRAAEMGDSYSQRNIGDLYYYGYGVSQDHEKAKEWYQKAADNGNSDAKEALKRFD